MQPFEYFWFSFKETFFLFNCFHCFHFIPHYKSKHNIKYIEIQSKCRFSIYIKKPFNRAKATLEGIRFHFKGNISIQHYVPIWKGRLI